ncbi:serine/threonine-protein phosphatase [Polaromonas sp. P1(28)-8]|nr:serine/threonine-protein phosphatase [Polaromonas sp. P1(28)-8]
MTRWLEEALIAMPSQGRLGMKVPGDLAFGFTDDRKTEKGNQDRMAIAYCLDASQSGESWFFAGVCDGVGGGAQGDVAASIALSEIISHLCVGESGPPERRLGRAILRAHLEVQQRLQKRSATTFVGIFVTDRGSLTIGSVGDSRIYSVSDDEAVKLTQDDTLAEMLRRQVPDSANQQIQDTIKALQSQWHDSLGQAIGSELPLQPHTSFWPHISPGSGYLLCTDGVWKPIEPMLAQVVRTSPGRKDLARRLLTLTDHLGATDNATAIVIPELTNIVQWLRSQHRTSEQGLVHLVLPGEMAVVPWSLFKQTPAPQEPSRVRPSETVKHETRDPQSEGKSKSKTKTNKTAKTAKTDKAAGVQMTIVEGPKNDEASAASTVPKEQ